MRASNEIRDDINKCKNSKNSKNSNPQYTQNLQAELLLDIRDQLGLLTEAIQRLVQIPASAQISSFKPGKGSAIRT